MHLSREEKGKAGREKSLRGWEEKKEQALLRQEMGTRE